MIHIATTTNPAKRIMGLVLKKVTGALQVALRFLSYQQHASDHAGPKDVSYCL